MESFPPFLLNETVPVRKTVEKVVRNCSVLLAPTESFVPEVFRLPPYVSGEYTLNTLRLRPLFCMFNLQ